VSGKALAVLLTAIFFSLATAQVTVADSWRQATLTGKGAASAAGGINYSFSGEDERLYFEVFVDGKLVDELKQRTRGGLVFAFRAVTVPGLPSGARVKSQILITPADSGPSVITVDRGRRSSTTETKQLKGVSEGPRTSFKLTVELLGASSAVQLKAELEPFGPLDEGRTYKLLSGAWGAGHSLAVYVTPLAD